MKNFTQKFIGLLALVFAMSFTANAQEIGDIYAGGIVFQINEDGTGLVADLQDLGEMTWHDAIDAAASAFSQGYDNWYLPSLDELELMYNTIGNGADNAGGFENLGDESDNYYWSSSVTDDCCAWLVSFNITSAAHAMYVGWYHYNKGYTFRFRVIRSVTFGEEGDGDDIVQGCLDPSAPNYIANANTDDGSCIYPGCIDETACNYELFVTVDDGTCEYAVEYCYDNDLDGLGDLSTVSWFCPSSLENGYILDCSDSDDQVWHEGSVAGCSDSIAFNYNPLANIESVSNTYFTNVIETGHTTYTSDFVDGAATLEVLSGEYKLYGQYEIQPGGISRLTLGEDAVFSLNSIDIQIEEAFLPIVAVVDTLGNVDYIENHNGPWECSYLGIDNFQSFNGTSFVYGTSYESCDDFPYPFVGLIITTSNGDEYISPSGIPEIQNVTWIDFTSFDSKIHLENFNMTSGETCESIVTGCTEAEYTQYNSQANTDDGTCLTLSIIGCTDAEALNYNPNANEDDETCIAVVEGCTDATSFNYNPEANTDDGSCVYLGCTDSDAFNYDSVASTDDGSCIAVVNGCIDATAFNYDSTVSANTDDGSCIAVVNGCIDATAFNYDTTVSANTDDGSCVAVLNGCIDDAYIEFNTFANTDDSSCTISVFLELPLGWSMFGYTCMESVDAIDGFIEISDKIEIVKDEWGLTYLPEWDFNAMGSLQFSEGYQIKMIEEVTDFQFCDLITQSDIDYVVAGYSDWIAPVYGCTSPDYCNYNPLANTDDGSCVYAQEGYYCDGNELPQIGDLHAGGIIFQINEDGTGLVADLDDLGEMNWHDAMVAANNATSQGYEDWYIPSTTELALIYNTIGNGGPDGNIVGLETGLWAYYWSSNDDGCYASNGLAWSGTSGGYTSLNHNGNIFYVRIIRAF